MTERKEPLTRGAWIEAALEAIARDGVDAVSVEPLARSLGATKGSFYWHFADRAELVAAAVEYWEAAATRQVIEDLAVEADPRRRLTLLLEDAFGDARIAIDAALAARGDDPVIGPVVQRITLARIAFLTEAFVECGLPRRRARRRAQISYSAYLGHTALARSDRGVPDVVGARSAYMRELIATLLVAEGASEPDRGAAADTGD